ncbi:MAG: chemotaxis protein CheW [Candidatus Omnitrophica bacterium]|nr:chemotaxis protein CheW [Candidatus Omnitrophota bacterium]
MFAVPSTFVREMVAMPTVSLFPSSPKQIRGVINLRGMVLPVLDLRIALGMRSFTEEIEDLVRLLDEREQDHKNWLAELESSVIERREFKLATDPHKCKFGMWYDTFKTENGTLSNSLKHFEKPHQRIHGIAIEVKELEKKGSYEAALSLIEHTRQSELSQMIKVFSEVRQLVREDSREIALIMDWNERRFAAAVDSIETVEQFSESDIGKMPESIDTSGNDFVAGIAKRKFDEGLVQILDVMKIMDAGGSMDLSLMKKDEGEED